MIVEEEKLAIDPIKLGGIRDWATPTTVKHVQQFLGFGNFYQYIFGSVIFETNFLTMFNK